MSDDPARPRIIVTVQGKVKPLIEVRPEKTVSFQGMADKLEEKHVELLSSLRTFHIKKLKDNLEEKATCRLETVEDGKHYRLAISNRLKQGNYRGSITLQTDLPDKPEVTIWVSGLIEGEIAVRPNTLVLGQLAAEQPVLTGKVLVTSNRNSAFKITKCTYDDKVISVTQSPLPGQPGFSLAISPNMKNVPAGGRLQTTLTVETDAPGGKHEVQVQVMSLAGTARPGK
ncbi:MAG: hypothetical protein ABFD97_04955 [Syntrophobacter sp.]